MPQHVLLYMGAGRLVPWHELDVQACRGPAHLQGLRILPRQLRSDLLCGWLGVLKTCITTSVHQLQEPFRYFQGRGLPGRTC